VKGFPSALGGGTEERSCVEKCILGLWKGVFADTSRVEARPPRAGEEVELVSR
jgi:hypothetical protein